MVFAFSIGFDFGDRYALVLGFVGIAVLAAIGALSHQHRKAFSAALIYLGLGLFAAALLHWGEANWLDPFEDASTLKHVAEFALIVALFSTGLKLDRRLGWRAWSSVARLLVIVMPISIGAVTLFGVGALGLSLAGALILAAVLAPTDPVLAGDIGVGPPGEEDEREPNFAITAEAGLNDGLAMPFVLLGLGLALQGDGGASWVEELGRGRRPLRYRGRLGIGVLAGWGLAAVVIPLRERRLLLPELDRWVALAAVLLLYGVTEAAGAYGFLAAFVGGIAFRRYERDHEMNERVHGGAETIEKLSELGTILLFGSMMTVAGLASPGWAGWLLALLLLLVVRPVAVAVGFVRSRLRWRERVFLGWFGVRGIGTVYYVAAVLAADVLGPDEGRVIFWTAAACVLVSILVHGITGTPLSSCLLDSPSRTTRPRWRGARVGAAVSQAATLGSPEKRP